MNVNAQIKRWSGIIEEKHKVSCGTHTKESFNRERCSCWMALWEVDCSECFTDNILYIK